MSQPTIPDVALVDNTEQRTPLVLVLDCSGSMAGQAIQQLNEGLRVLEQELKADAIASKRVRLLLVEYGGLDQVNVPSEWQDAMDFVAPELEANGTTPTGQAVDVALQPGLQDSLSVQLALIHELLAGRTPETFVMLDRDEIKDYLYTAEGKERVKTALGEHDTVRYRSRRPNSDRSTMFWCAPDLGYLPVKVERHKGSKIEWSMTLATLTR